jgi:hypothetical protein
MPDTTVILGTTPAARNRLGEIADYAPESLGLDPRGFLRLRLRL